MELSDKRNTLHKATIAAVKADPRTLRVIAQATGIPFYWLKKLSADEIASPGVNRVQYLFEFLSKSKLIDK